MADGKVVIEILGDPAKFNEAVSGLSASTSSALSRVSSSMVGWGAGLSAAVTAPLTAAGVKAAQWALTTSSAAEQADIALSTMLGPERAKQMIADLTDFAKKTPFEMSGLTDATQKLLAYGFAAEDVIPTLTAIGDATAALGSGQEGIDACTRAIGQMQAKGKVMSEEMLQLTEQGIPAWQYLADALGTDVAGAQEKVTKGSVDAATGIAALKAGMEGDFGGLMAEQSKTLAGALSNLGDAAEGAVKGIYKTDAYRELASSLAGLADPLGELVEDLMPTLEGAMSSAAGAVSGLSSAVSELSPEQVSAIAQALGLAAAAGPALMVAGNAWLRRRPGRRAGRRWPSPASTAAAKAAGTALPAAAKGASGAFRAVKWAVGEGIAYVQLFREDAEGMAGLTWDALSGGAKRATDIVVNGLTEADVALAAFRQDPLGRITVAFSRLASTAGPALPHGPPPLTPRPAWRRPWRLRRGRGRPRRRVRRPPSPAR
ncbi:MAG: tape measure protein [Paratractidigestivibacter faecalis]